MADAVRIERTLAGLESAVLPLDEAPMVGTLRIELRSFAYQAISLPLRYVPMATLSSFPLADYMRP